MAGIKGKNMVTKVLDFINEVKQETKKVTWPTRRDTMLSVLMVLIMVSIAGIFFLMVDLAISKIVTLILGV